jgi:diketogulonate reductase-like aldo/keto reductase
MFEVSANGANIPALGFGTFRMSDEEVARVLPEALRLGFRHVDTAQIYKNEAAVGDVLASSGIPRTDIFLTTKVWVDRVGHEAFIASVEESLAKLKTDYVDLLLLHWPQSEMPLADRIGALNELKKAGKVKNIGVSNFSVPLIQEAVKLSDAPLATNQVEYHPYLDQTKVLAEIRQHGMSLTSYYLMANGAVPNDDVLKDIGAKHGKTAAQVALRWAIQQKDVVALSKTAKVDRLPENYDVFGFSLSPEEMQAIHALARPNGRIVNPGHLAPTWDD